MFDSLSPLPSPTGLLRRSVLLRLFVIGFLMLGLLIPLVMISSLVGERKGRRAEAAQEIAARWGRQQQVAGPVVVVPFQVLVLSDNANQPPRLVRETAYFLPDELKVEAKLEPERRRRGIFEVVVYRTQLRVSGRVAPPDLAALGIQEGAIVRGEAKLELGFPDLRGIDSSLAWKLDGRPLPPVATTGSRVVGASALASPLPDLGSWLAGKPLTFELEIPLRGSEAIRFLPLGRATAVTVASPWPSPSFQGAFLPEERTVSPAGFTARWQVSELGRGFGQSFRTDRDDWQAILGALSASSFGVDLYQPVDGYQQTERALKYGVLFLALTFLAFFLFEVFFPLTLHPVHYLFVGLALCLFYVLLLALSEHTPFGLAYGVAAGAVVLLLGGYSAAILGARSRALGLAGALAGLYGYLWVLLQAEDYALLLGAGALFVLLALAMYLTRRVDWYVGKAAGPG
jgi:inner membrane protein